MINSDAVQAVAAAHWSAQFVRPIYDGYGFAAIPNTIERLLTGRELRGLPASALAGMAERYETVVLIFLDAFGERFCMPRLDQYPFLRRFAREGIVSPLTTLFPSTTSAHVTLMHTGHLPARSGIYEWFQYEPSLDLTIAPLLFAPAGDHTRESLNQINADPQRIFPQDTLYQRLAAAGVRSKVLQHRDYAHSTYTHAVCQGASLVPFRTLAEALTSLGRLLEAQRHPSYYYLYLDSIDTICHLYGPESPYVDAEIDLVLLALERCLQPVLAARTQPTLVLLVADHGQIAIDPNSTIYVNRMVPALEQGARRGMNGRLLHPAGSRRNLFLHVYDEHLEHLVDQLQRALVDRAEVYRTADLLSMGLFGPPPYEALRPRLGNVAVLPYAHETVWWHDPAFRETTHRGAHGGLSTAEAHTQIAALEYGGS
jgi:predicted AlkP superfamily pyrophosphatase or phosphodiesterase